MSVRIRNSTIFGSSCCERGAAEEGARAQTRALERGANKTQQHAADWGAATAPVPRRPAHLDKGADNTQRREAKVLEGLRLRAGAEERVEVQHNSRCERQGEPPASSCRKDVATALAGIARHGKPGKARRQGLRGPGRAASATRGLQCSGSLGSPAPSAHRRGIASASACARQHTEGAQVRCKRGWTPAPSASVATERGKWPQSPAAGQTWFRSSTTGTGPDRGSAPGSC